MANPQLEDGYTRIANELLEALISAKLSGQELRLALFVIRKTYGFGKKEDMISLSQMRRAIGASKSRCSVVIGQLQLRKIVTVTENLNGTSKKYKLNKDFHSWKGVAENRNRSCFPQQGVQVFRNRGLRKIVTTKETITKENIQKKIYVEGSDELRLSSLLFDLIRANNPEAKEPNLQVWTKHIDRMIRLDKRTPEKIETVIRASQKHSFWHKNILSTAKLREKYDRLILDMNESKKRYMLEDLPRLKAQLAAARKDKTYWEQQVKQYGDKHRPKVEEQARIIAELEPEIARLEGVR